MRFDLMWLLMLSWELSEIYENRIRAEAVFVTQLHQRVPVARSLHSQRNVGLIPSLWVFAGCTLGYSGPETPHLPE